MSQWGPPGQPGFAPPPPPPPSSAPARSRGPILVVVAVVVILAVAAVLVIAGVFDRDPDDTRGGGPEPEPRSSQTSKEPEEVVPGVTIGTPDNPYSPGDSFTVLQDWTFTVGATDTDAWPDIAPQLVGIPDVDVFQPDPGMVFVMAPASMTYTGPPTDQNRVKAFFVNYVASDGTLIYPVCGLSAPFRGLDWSAVDQEPSNEGMLCAQVLPEQVEGGQWQITMYTIDDDGTQHLVEVYYAFT